MKKFISLLLVLTMVMSLVACGNNTADNAGSDTQTGNTTQTETPSTETPADEGEPITDLVTWEISSKEVAVFLMLNSEDSTDLNVLCNTYSGLLEFDNKGRLTPAVASEWGSEDGGLTWTFKLRDDVTWVDVNGNYKADCTAQDWLTAMEWILNFHKNGAKNTTMPMAMLKGAEDYYNYTKELSADEAYALTADGKFAEMVGIEAPDDYTLIYHCSKNAPYFDTLCTSAALFPLCAAEVEEIGVENMLAISPENMWYNGAYTITSYIPNNEKILTKNEAYWDKDYKLFDTVTIRMIADGNMDDQLFETGEVDHADLNEATLKKIYEDKNHPLHDNLVEKLPKARAYQFHFNYAKNNEDGTPDTNYNTAIANTALRKSLAYGLDLTNYWARTNYINPTNCEALTYTAKGLLYFSDGTEYSDKVTEGLGLPTTANADGSSRRLDMEKAMEYKAQAMSELEGKVTFPVEFDYYIQAGNQTALDSAIVLKESFEALGTDYITLNICTYVSSQSKEVYQPQLQSFGIAGWGADYGDAENFIGQELYGNDNAYYSNNMSNINDVDPAAAPELIAAYEEFTALAEKASGICDDMDARYQAYVDAEVCMLENILTLPCYYSVVWQLTNINDYSKMNGVYGALNYMYKNWETSTAGYSSEQYEQIKAEYNG